MKSTPPLKLIAGILCFLSIVSANAMTKHKHARFVDKMFQTPLDTLGVSVSQNSKYLMVGQDIEITVQVCRNKERITEISIGGIVIPPDQNGTAFLKLPGGSVGMHKIDVEIKFIDSNDKLQVKTYTIEYEVGQSQTVIDAGNLNLLYIGVDNPLYISTAVSSDQITVTVNGGGSAITKSMPGVYIVRVSAVSNKCIVSVSVDNKLSGAKIFRVVNLPDPEVTLGNYISGSRISANEFWNQPGVKVAAIKDFPFTVNYKVIGYTIKILAGSTTSKSFKSTGAQFSPDLKKYASQLKPGSVIVIDDITVEESTVRKIKLPSLVYFID